MSMKAERVVELCEQSAALIREDMALIEEGGLTFESSLGSVNHDLVARMRVVVSYLQEIVDGCGCDCTR